MKKTSSLSLILFLAGSLTLLSCNSPREENEQPLRGPAEDMPVPSPTDPVGVDTAIIDTSRTNMPVHP